MTTGQACAFAAVLAMLLCASGALLDRDTNPILSVAAIRHAPTRPSRLAAAPVQPLSVQVIGTVRAYNPSTGLLSVDNGSEQYKLRAPGSFTVAQACGPALKLAVGQKIIASVTAYMSGNLVVQSIELAEPYTASMC